MQFPIGYRVQERQVETTSVSIYSLDIQNTKSLKKRNDDRHSIYKQIFAITTYLTKVVQQTDNITKTHNLNTPT